MYIPNASISGLVFECGRTCYPFHVVYVGSEDARYCTVPKYHAAVDYTPRLRASQNLPRCMANSDTCEAVANNYPGSTTANSYPGTTST